MMMLHSAPRCSAIIMASGERRQKRRPVANLSKVVSMSQSFILLLTVGLGARVKVSAARMRREYLGAGAVLAVARLRDKLVGHATAVVRKDDEGFKGDFKGLCRTNQRRSDVDNSTRCTSRSSWKGTCINSSSSSYCST